MLRFAPTSPDIKSGCIRIVKTAEGAGGVIAKELALVQNLVEIEKV